MIDSSKASREGSDPLQDLCNTFHSGGHGSHAGDLPLTSRTIVCCPMQ